MSHIFDRFQSARRPPSEQVKEVIDIVHVSPESISLMLHGLELCTFPCKESSVCHILLLAKEGHLNDSKAMIRAQGGMKEGPFTFNDYDNEI